MLNQKLKFYYKKKFKKLKITTNKKLVFIFNRLLTQKIFCAKKFKFLRVIQDLYHLNTTTKKFDISLNVL